jgi:hypothetical protein
MHKVPISHLQELAKKADQINEKRLPPEFANLKALLAPTETKEFYWDSSLE